ASSTGTAGSCSTCCAILRKRRREGGSAQRLPAGAVAPPMPALAPPRGRHLVDIRLVRQQAVGPASRERQREGGNQAIASPLDRNRPDQDAGAVVPERAQGQH